MLSHEVRVAGAAPRSGTDSLVVRIDGPAMLPAIRDAIVAGAAASWERSSDPNDPGGLVWEDPDGLPDCSEAGLGFTLGRMAAVMAAAALGAPHDQCNAVRVLLHKYSPDVTVLVMSKDKGSPAQVDLHAGMRQIMAAYSKAAGEPFHEVQATPLPDTGSSAALFAPRVPVTDEGQTLDALLAATCAVLALTGSRMIGVDVSLPETPPGAGRSIVPVALSYSREPRLAEMLAQVRANMAHAYVRNSTQLHFHTGCVLVREPIEGLGYACGPLRMSVYHITNFADWDMKVTLSHPGEWRINIDCSLFPSDIGQLVVHLFRCVLSRPDVLLLDAPEA